MPVPGGSAPTRRSSPRSAHVDATRAEPGPSGTGGVATSASAPSAVTRIPHGRGCARGSPGSSPPPARARWGSSNLKSTALRSCTTRYSRSMPITPAPGGSGTSSSPRVTSARVSAAGTVVSWRPSSGGAMAIGSMVARAERGDDVVTRLSAAAAASAFVVAFAGCLAVLVQRGPVVAPSLPGRERMLHWPLAIAGLAVVAGTDAFTVSRLRRARPSSSERRSWYRLLVALGLLQLGHLAEHSIQVGQLLATSGDLDRSHGLVGNLDFETVHFVWDSAVWLLTGALLVRFRHNRWLWLSFAAASLHEVEHLYLFAVYMMHTGFYFDGGFAGILGRNGLIGSPLFRPYLHFAYNVVVVVPLLIAVWFETRDRAAVQGRSGQRVL